MASGLNIFLMAAMFTAIPAHGQAQAPSAQTDTSVHARSSSYTPAQHLVNYALSACLAQGFPRQPIEREALAAAGGYVELGAYDAEAYHEAQQLAQRYLQKSYLGKHADTELTVMKCVDLMYSAELQDIVRRYQTELETRLRAQTEEAAGSPVSPATNSSP